MAFINAFHQHPKIRGLADLSQTEELTYLLGNNLPVEHSELRTLQGLTLSDRTGFFHTVKHEAKVIAQFMGLSYEEFKQSAESLRRRGIIVETDWDSRGVHHRIVLPRLFAVYLARQVWAARGDDVLDELLSSQSGELRSLRLGILSRLADLGNRRIAVPVVGRFTYQDYETFDDIAQDAETFRLLGEADPQGAINHLNRLMQNVSLVDLREFKSERRSIIPLFTSHLRLEETFWTAARLVGRFAAAENETLGNNATGIWQGIFFIRSGSNPIAGLERFRLIRDFLDMPESEMRLVAVKAIESLLDNYEGGTVTRGPGGYITPPTWKPETWNEFWDIRRTALQLLTSIFSDTENDIANAASECSLHYSMHQVPVLLDEVIDQFRELAQRPEYRLRVWKKLQEIMNYEGVDFEEDQLDKVGEFSSELITDSYHDQLEIYVADFDVFERGYHGQFEETKKIFDQKLGELARLGYENESLLETEMDWLVSLKPWGNNSQVYSFMHKLGQLDGSHRWFSELLSRTTNREQLWLVDAYLRGRIADNETDWVKETVIDWTENSELYAQAILMLPEIAGENDEIVAILASLLGRSWIVLMDLTEQRLERHCTDTLSVEAMRSLLNLITQNDNPDGICVGTSYLHRRLHDRPEEASHYSDIALKLLQRSVGEDTDVRMFRWYREQLENLYLEEYPRELSRVILQNFKESNGYIFEFVNDRDSVRKLLIRAIGIDDQVALDILKRAMLNEDNSEYISSSRLSGLHINRWTNSATLLDWAARHQPGGPRHLAELCFVGDVPLEETVRGLIVQYFEDEQLLAELASKFTHLGVMEVSQIPLKLRELRDLARDWLADESPHVRQWAQEIIERLENRLLEYDD